MQTLAERVTWRLGRALGRWGVDAAQYHWLLQTSLKLDFRSEQPGVQQWGGQSGSALKWMLLINLLVSSLCSLVIAYLEPSTLLFSGLTLTYGLMLLAMMVLVEFGSSIVNPDDYPVLASRPVDSRTYFAVKLSNLLFYVLLIAFSLSLPPALIGVLRSPQAILFPLAYLTAAVAGSVFVAGAIVALYGVLLRLMSCERFKDVLMYCQVALGFLFFVGYQAVPMLLGSSREAFQSDAVRAWMYFAPPFWFAGLGEALMLRLNTGILVLSGLALGGTLLALPRVFAALSLDYSDRLAGMLANSTGTRKRTARPGAPATWLDRCFLHAPHDRAFFHFYTIMMKRSRHWKMQVLPNVGMMLAMVVFYFFRVRGFDSGFMGGQAMLSMIMPILAVVFLVGIVIVSLANTDEFGGAWIFSVTPISQPWLILRGVKRVLFLLLLLPISVLMAVALSFFWPAADALAAGAYILLTGKLCMQVVLFFLKQVPFTRKPSKGAQALHLVALLATLPAMGVAIGLLTVATMNWTGFALVMLGLAAFSLLLGWLNERHFVTGLKLAATNAGDARSEPGQSGSPRSSEGKGKTSETICIKSKY